MASRSARFADVLRLLGAFVVASMLLGLLAAGLAIPAVGATGAAARQTVHAFDSLPGVFTQTPLSQQSRILASDGSLIASPSAENRKVVTLAQVAPIMAQAQIDIEDNRFYQHGGVDLHGVARAIVANAQGGSIQGASTLTQQYVKITLQENAIRSGDTKAAQEAVAPSLARKLQQLKYAIVLEQTESKKQILAGYLNLVYYGGRAYGIEAAAEHYFGIHAKQLNLPQSALLAGLVQEPTALDPAVNPSDAKARRNVVLDTMHKLGHVSDTSWRAAVKSGLDLHLTPSLTSCAASKYPYVCDYILRWLREQPALGKTVTARNAALDRDGLTIRTSFDPAIQKVAQAKINARVPVNNSAGISAATTVVQPGTGAVLAMAQNSTYTGRGATQVNYNVDYKYGNSIGFPFGSTAKTYAVVAALQSGMTGDSPVTVKGASPIDHKAVFYPSEYRRDGCRQYTAYRVGNDEGSTTQRVLPLTKVLASSINIAFAGLIAKLGLCTVHKVMDEMGLHQSSGASIQTYAPSITLGANSVSPMTLAASYATLAAQGVYCKPQPVVSITNSAGKMIAVPGKQCTQAISPDVAAAAADILSHVLTDGTAKAVGLVRGRPSAGKTGTTDGNKQVWFAGFTAQLASAVWVGTAKVPKPMNHVRLNGKLVGGSGKVYGANTAAPLWKDITTEASVGMPVKGFGPGGAVGTGNDASTTPASATGTGDTSGGGVTGGSGGGRTGGSGGGGTGGSGGDQGGTGGGGSSNGPVIPGATSTP